MTATVPETGPGDTLDVASLRKAFGRFATGVTVVTARQPDGTPRGFTANSFTSVSMDPPLLLVCIGKSAASLDTFLQAGTFAVNILAESQKDVSGLFASRRPDKFETCAWRPGPAGTPLVEGALAWFECSRHDAVDAGDHVILIGRITRFDHADGNPLGFYQGGYFTIGVEDRLVEAIGHGAHPLIGAVYEKDGGVLLEEAGGQGGLRVPAVGRDGRPGTLAELHRRYAGAPLSGTIEFVYAVFEDRRSHSVGIFYRGSAEGDAPEGTRFYAFDDIPWERLTDSAEKSMLERYVREARAAGFAIYVGDETQGAVRAVR